MKPKDEIDETDETDETDEIDELAHAVALLRSDRPLDQQGFGLYDREIRNMIADIIEYHLRWRTGKSPGPPPKTMRDRFKASDLRFFHHSDVRGEISKGKTYKEATADVAKAIYRFNREEVKSRRSGTDRSELAIRTFRTNHPKKSFPPILPRGGWRDPPRQFGAGKPDVR